MGDVSTTLTVDVHGIGDVESMAEALGRLAEADDKAMATLGRPIAFAGLGDLGKQLDAAAGQAEAAAARIDAAFKGIGEGGGAGLAGISGQLKGLDEVADSAAGSLAATGDALKEVDAAGAGIAGTLGTAADATKGLAETQDAVKASSDGMAESLKAATAVTADNRDAMVAAGAAADDLAASHVAAMTVIGDTSAASAGASAIDDTAASSRTAAKEARALKEANEASAASAAESAKKYHLLTLGIAGAVGYGTYLAANLQTGTNRLYTSAGESLKNLPMISKGILALSGQTDTSQASLLSGAYMTESAGFHGKDALAVLRSGAEGAYSEGADLGTTTNALTTTLDDYFGGAKKSPVAQQNQATAAMNSIMASVSAGKMTLQGLASALPTVLPSAQAAGLKLPQVLGAMSTLTAEGTSPDEAAQEIRGTVRAIQKPSGVQSAEMQMLGINPVQFAAALGKQGLTGAVQEADKAIQSHTKSGLVDLDVMNQSKLATQSANAAVTQLPKNLRSVAEGYLSGKVGESQWYALTGTKSALPAEDVNLLKQFATVANTAHGFSSMIKSGQGDKQTAGAALNELFGGQTGQAVGLGLGGEHMKTFAANVDTVGRSVSHTGTNIQGWSRVQDSLNFKLGSFTKSLEAVATEVGQVALPGLTKIAGGASDVLGFAASHQAVTQDALIGGGILALPALLSKVASPITTLASSAGRLGHALGVPGAEKLASVGQSSSGAAGAGTLESAAGSLSGAGGDLAGAAADLSGAAGKLTTGAGDEPGGKPGPVPGEENGPGVAPIAGAERTATEGESLGEDAAEAGGGALGLGMIARMLPAAMSDIAANANPIGMGVSAALFARGVGDHLAPKGTMAGAENQVSQHTADPDANAVNYIVGGFLASAFSSHALSPQRSGLGQGSVADARLGIQGTPAPPQAEPAAAPAVFTESLKRATGEPLSASALQSAAKNVAATGDVKLKVNIDSAALDAAKAHITSMLAGLDGGKQVKPVVIPPPNLSGVEQAKSKVAADMGAITGAMKSEAGPAAGAGSAVAAGFAGGISSGSGAVAAAAESLGQTAMASLRASIQSHSPSRLTEVEGKNYDDGYILGIESGISGVAAAAAKIAQASADPLKGSAKIGKETVANLEAGLQGGQSAITAAQDLAKGIAAPFKDTTISGTITTLESDVAAALKKHTISKSEDSGMVAYLKADNTRLQHLAQQRQTLETQIQQAEGYAQNITASANQGANIVTIASGIQSADSSTSAPAPAPTYQASDLISGMQAQVQQTKQFTGDLAKLKKEGLNKAEIDQISQAGAAAGDPVAQALLAGGPKAIKEMDKLQAQMNQAAKQLGTTASNAVYEPAKDLGKGIAAGLKASLGQVNQEMSATGKDILSTLHAALTGGAAAAEFAGLGTRIANEIAQGIDAASGTISKAVQDAAEGKTSKSKSGGSSSSPAHSDAVSHPATAAGGGSPGGSAGHYGGGGSPPVQSSHTANITVTLDGAVVGRSTQSWLLSHGSQNQQTGVVPKGQNKTA